MLEFALMFSVDDDEDGDEEAGDEEEDGEGEEADEEDEDDLGLETVYKDNLDVSTVRIYSR